jgi:nucleotide-binding universal stress UspA family protein
MLWNKILLVYDGTEGSDRAIDYLMKMFGQAAGVEVTLLGLYEKLPDHDLKDTSQIVEKLDVKLGEMKLEIQETGQLIQEAGKRLVNAGFEEKYLHVKFTQRSAAAHKDILDEARRKGCGTIVVGRSHSRHGVIVGGDVFDDLKSHAPELALVLV